MSFQTFRRDLRHWLQTFDAAESFERFRESPTGKKVIRAGIALSICGLVKARFKMVIDWLPQLCRALSA